MIGRRVRRGIELKIKEKGEHYGSVPIGYCKKDSRRYINKVEAAISEKYLNLWLQE